MKPLIVITGPTACGKTQIAVQVAKRVNGEVVSADSMLVYRGMDIGTAKPDKDEQAGIPHHLIDVAAPDEDFSAARYQELAYQAIESIHMRGHVPVLAGGTGFYINSVVYGSDFTPVAEPAEEQAYRQTLRRWANEHGPESLHTRLQQLDPEAAAAIHPNNVKRVIRALSFYHSTGQRLSAHNTQQRRHTPVFPTLFIVLHRERSALYARIDARVDDMLKKGLVAEVQGLLDAGYHENLVSMQGLGYKETARYLRGASTWAQMADAIKTGTRHYAKRQLTWFTHRAPDARWLRVDENPGAAAEWAAEWLKVGEESKHG